MRVCSECASTNVHFNKRAKRLLCDKHASQLATYGRILESTKFDPNVIVRKGDVAWIMLRNEKQKVVGKTIIDSDDVERVSGMKWFKCPVYGYALGRRRGEKRLIRLSRFIIGAKKGQEVDHINRDRLDNRKANLRIVTHQQNTWNMSKHKDGKYPKGVTKNLPYSDKFRAQLCVDGKNMHLGYFKRVGDAIAARKAAEKKYFRGII